MLSDHERGQYPKSNTIRISPLRANISESDIFAFIGPAVSCSPIYFHFNFLRSAADVAFQNVRDAKRCCYRLDGKDLDCPLANERYKVSVTQIPPQSHNTRIIRICNLSPLSPLLTEQDIADHIRSTVDCAYRCRPENVYLFHHPQTLRDAKNAEITPGFALVELENANVAMSCVRKAEWNGLMGTKLKNHKSKLLVYCTAEKSIRRKFERKSHLRGKTKMVLLWNLYRPALEEEGKTKEFVHGLCSRFGTVCDIQIARDSAGFQMMGAAILMDSERAAEAVFDGLHGTSPNGSRLRICTVFKVRAMAQFASLSVSAGYHAICIGPKEGDHGHESDGNGMNGRNGPFERLSKGDIHWIVSSRLDSVKGSKSMMDSIVDIGFEGMAHQRMAVLYIENEAMNAVDTLMERLEGHKMAGTEMRVWKKERECHLGCRRLKDISCWIRISNLDATVTESVLKQFVGSNGVKHIYLIHHFSKGTVPGFAYLECNSATTATAMVYGLRGKLLKERRVWTEWTEDRKQWILNRNFGSESRVIEIGHLHCTVSVDDIKRMIKIYCGATRQLTINMIYDDNGFPLGVVRVVADKEERARKIVEALNGKMLRGFEMMAYFVVAKLGEMSTPSSRRYQMKNISKLLKKKKDPFTRFNKDKLKKKRLKMETKSKPGPFKLKMNQSRLRKEFRRAKEDEYGPSKSGRRKFYHSS